MSGIAIAIAGYLVLQLAFGVWASRFVRKESDYLLAGRSLGFGLVTLSLFATWFGSETVMGSSAAVAQEGLAGGRADPFGYSLCLLGMGLFLAYRLRQRNYVTVADFFRERYSRSVELAGSLLFIPSILVWAGAQLLAFGQLLAIATGMGVPYALMFATLLVVAYTTLGGLLGDVVTDVVQGAVVIIGLIILLGAVTVATGGPGAALARIEPAQLTFVGAGESVLGRLDVWAVPVLGSLVSQVALSRVLAARSAGVARNACFGAFGLYLCVGVIPVLIALVGTHLIPLPEDRDQFLPAIAREMLPGWLFVVFMGALISAILSTVDSTLLTVAALVSHNVVLPVLPALSERNKVLLTRGVVVLTGIAAFAIALAQYRAGDSILNLVIFADSLGTSGLLVIVLIGLHAPRFGGQAAALAALALGVVGYPVASVLLKFEAPFLFSLTAALIGYAAVSLLEARMART